MDYILRGRAALYHHEGTTPERFAYAIECFENALALDSRSVDTQALLAIALIGRVFEQMTEDDTVRIFNAINAYYIARTGDRLTMEDLRPLIAAGVLAEV